MMFEIRRPSIRRRRVSIAIPLAASAFALAVFWNASPAIAQTPGPSTAPVDIYHSTNDDGVHPDPSLPPGCVAGAGSPGASNVLVFEPVAQGRGAALVADLTALGHTATLQTSLPTDLSVYASIWYVAAFEAITTADQDRLRSFIQGGGGVHLTGERPCCETLNASVQALVNSVVVGGGITVGNLGDPLGPYPINATAVGGVATNPNALAVWNINSSPGGIAVPDPENVFAASANPGIAVGAVWDSSELVGGNGRLSVLMDWDWFQAVNPPDRLPVIENLQAFLGAGASGGGNVCVLNGGANERLNVWIDGGNTASGEGETVCKFGADGGSGDNLCGADMLIEMTGGSLTGIEPTVDTLVCSPSCANCDANEIGICPLPAGTTSIRMNFRRGDYAPPNAPPVGPRRVATLIVESSGNSAQSPSRVFASGVAAAGANLQVRRIANAADVCTGAGQPFACCTGAGTGDGEWPCGPRVIATGDVPEPAQILQLLGGLVGMSYLYRLRRRA